MKLNNIITENFSTVSINGILFSLNNDEKSIYDKIKKDPERKLFKKDLDEFDQRIASNMVTRGLLQRRKNPQHEIYFTTKGRRKNAVYNRPLDEVAPPDTASEKWIEKNKDRFKEKYGKNYKKYLYGKAWNMYNGSTIKESYEKILIEGINELQKYFPKIPLEKIKELVALDPTYKGGNELGKYGKWILKLYNNHLKNNATNKKYEELLQQYPDGINPKNGQHFQEPNLLPEIKDEDLYKLTDSLKQFDVNQKDIKKSIDDFETLADLDKELSNLKNNGIPTNKLALKRYNLMQKAVEKGFDIKFEDNDWIMGIPTTLESSCMFGDDTSWCTTSKHSGYYNRYSEEGTLFINLNKNTGQLYQFHFQTESFMDEFDKQINLVLLVRLMPQGLKEIYNNYVQEHINEPRMDLFTYLFKEHLDKKDEEEILSYQPFNEIIQYVQHPTKKIEQHALKVSISNVQYIEHISDKLIDEIVTDYVNYVPLIVHNISDKKLLSLISKKPDLFAKCYKKYPDRFSNEFFTEIIKHIDFNADVSVETVKLPLDKLEILMNHLFNIKNLPKNVEINIQNFFEFYPINELSTNLRYIYIVIKPFIINNLENVEETDIQAIIDSLKYKVVPNKKVYDLVSFGKIQSISPESIDKSMELIKLNYKNNLNMNFIGLIPYFSFEQNKTFMELNPSSTAFILNEFKTGPQSEKYYNYIFDCDTKEIYKLFHNIPSYELTNGIREIITNFCLPNFNKFNETVQYNMIYFVILVITNNSYQPQIYKILKNLYKYCPNMPLALQKQLINGNIEYSIGIQNMDERLQNKLIDKNPFNIKFINNPSEKIVQKAYELNPETQNYIR